MMNLSFGIPKKNQNPSFSWRPFIVFGIILVVALGMRAYQWVRGPAVPSANIESISWDEQMATTDGGTDVIDGEGTNVTDGEGDSYSGLDQGSSVGALREQEALDVGLVSGMTDTVLPDAINLAVPFTSQAPLGIWDEFTEETCEEASLLMVYEYYQGAPEGALSPTTVDADLHAMVLAEESLQFGPSISAEQFVLFAKTYNGTQAHVIENPSLDDLRTLLAAGHPVIVPAFGRLLGNPFFTGEGPLYHMLVLRGYTPTAFITNDPGTRHGENYQYPFETLMAAIGNWDGDSPDGGKSVIVIDP